MELALMGLAFLVAINVATFFCLVILNRMAWRIAIGIGWVIGSIVGYQNAAMEYWPQPDMKIYGYPFPAAALILEGEKGKEQWIDYVSPFGIVVIALNFLIYFSPVTFLLGPFVCLQTLKIVKSTNETPRNKDDLGHKRLSQPEDNF